MGFLEAAAAGRAGGGLLGSLSSPAPSISSSETSAGAGLKGSSSESEWWSLDAIFGRAQLQSPWSSKWQMRSVYRVRPRPKISRAVFAEERRARSVAERKVV